MKVFKMIFSMVLIALSVIFMSCSKENESDGLELSKAIDEKITGAWSSELSNGDVITCFFKEDGTALWQEKTSKGIVTIEDLRFLYNKSSLKGSFIFDRPNVKRLFKNVDNTLHVYSVEGDYIYFKRSNNKPEAPTPIVPVVIPEPEKPIIPEVIPEPEKPVIPQVVGKWRHDNDGFYYTYELKADGTFEYNEFKGGSKKKTSVGTYTYNSKMHIGRVTFENDGSDSFKFKNDILSVYVFVGLYLDFKRVA